MGVKPGRVVPGRLESPRRHRRLRATYRFGRQAATWPDRRSRVLGGRRGRRRHGIAMVPSSELHSPIYASGCSARSCWAACSHNCSGVSPRCGAAVSPGGRVCDPCSWCVLPTVTPTASAATAATAMMMMRFKVPHDPGTRPVRHGASRQSGPNSDDGTGALDENRKSWQPAHFVRFASESNGSRRYCSCLEPALSAPVGSSVGVVQRKGRHGYDRPCEVLVNTARFVTPRSTAERPVAHAASGRSLRP